MAKSTNCDLFFILLSILFFILLRSITISGRLWITTCSVLTVLSQYIISCSDSVIATGLCWQYHVFFIPTIHFNIPRCNVLHIASCLSLYSGTINAHLLSTCWIVSPLFPHYYYHNYYYYNLSPGGFAEDFQYIHRKVNMEWNFWEREWRLSTTKIGPPIDRSFPRDFIDFDIGCRKFYEPVLRVEDWKAELPQTSVQYVRLSVELVRGLPLSVHNSGSGVRL